MARPMRILGLLVLFTASATAGEYPHSRPLDELEAIFAKSFRPDINPDDTKEPSAFGVHCIASAAALKLAKEGADFPEEFIDLLERAMTANADLLVSQSGDWTAGWGDKGEAKDRFNDGTVNPAKTADGYNTSYALWCLAEASSATTDGKRAKTYRDYALTRWAAYTARGYRVPIDGRGLCDDCGYFWYSTSVNDRNRYVKNVNIMMGLASLMVGRDTGFVEAIDVGRQAVRSHSRELGGDGIGNLEYLGKLDPDYPRPSDAFNTHNHLEALAFIQAAALINSPVYADRALKHFQAWRVGYKKTDAFREDKGQRIFLAACSFARLEAAAKTICLDWIKTHCTSSAGRCINNQAAIGLVSGPGRH